MNRQQLVDQIHNKSSFLCIGLDPDLTKFPNHLEKNAKSVLTFNQNIIEHTHDLAIAYKPNIAFYEALGAEGWDVLEETSRSIPDNIFRIADAKRGDIGNTAKQYAKAFFERMNFDAITISPYMGIDSVQPFLEYDNKWVIILGLTSNTGSKDLQQVQLNQNRMFFEEVMERCAKFGSLDQVMFVVGATQSEHLDRVRSIVPDHFLLVPGIGAQGGDLRSTFHHLASDDVGIIVNSTRSIIYAGDGEDYAQQARSAAENLVGEMGELLKNLSN